MQPVELSRGLWRWSAPHPEWKPGAAAGSSADWPREVGCVLVETADAAVFIDALVPPGATAFWRWADRHCKDRRVLALSTIGFHRRSRDTLVERYGATTSRAKRNLPEGVDAIALRGAGETIFWLPEHRALVPGDRIVGDDGDPRRRATHPGGDAAHLRQGIARADPGTDLRICPDTWLAYLPSKIVAADLRELLQPLLELPVERVLVSHGEPVLKDGHAALARALR